MQDANGWLSAFPVYYMVGVGVRSSPFLSS